MKSVIPAFCLRELLTGLRSYVVDPGAGDGGSRHPAHYSYSIWLRHLSFAALHGLSTPPASIAELGPGPTLESGLAAMLSGVQTYWAYDIRPYARLRSSSCLDALATFYRERALARATDEFEDAELTLPSRQFPRHLFPEERLERCLSPARRENLQRVARQALREMNVLATSADCEEQLGYFCDWPRFVSSLSEKPVEMLFSQVAMEYVDDLTATYRDLFRCVQPGGLMSHQIDFSAHESSPIWNGHWSYSDTVWRMIRGKKPYYINRQPLSAHLNAMRLAGFEIVKVVTRAARDGLARRYLAACMQHLTDEDCVTRRGFLLARRPP